MKNILVISEGGGSNLGDNAILYSIVSLLKMNNINVDCWNYSKVFKIDQIETDSDIKFSKYKSKYNFFNFIKKFIPNKIKWLIKNKNKFLKLKKRYDILPQIIQTTFPKSLFLPNLSPYATHFSFISTISLLDFKLS